VPRAAQSQADNTAQRLREVVPPRVQKIGATEGNDDAIFLMIIWAGSSGRAGASIPQI
jgi:hypothetical protein